MKNVKKKLMKYSRPIYKVDGHFMKYVRKMHKVYYFLKKIQDW